MPLFDPAPEDYAARAQCCPMDTFPVGCTCSDDCDCMCLDCLCEAWGEEF